MSSLQYNKKPIICLYDGGIGLPDFEIYLEEKDTPANKHSEKRSKYSQFITSLFSLAGLNVEGTSEIIMRIETELARVFLSKKDGRDPDKKNNILPVAGLWRKIFDHWGI